MPIKEKTYVRKVVSNSRDKGKCPVCDVLTRMDKLKIYFSKYVLWDDNGTVSSSACEPSNPRCTKEPQLNINVTLIMPGLKTLKVIPFLAFKL